MAALGRRAVTWSAGVAGLLAVALLAGYLLVVVPGQRDDAARAVAERVAQAWEASDLTGAPVADGVAAQATYEEVAGGLGVDPAEVDVVDLQRDGDTATATLEVTWPFGEGWTYRTALPLTRDPEAGDGGAWTGALAPDVLHPDLAAGDRLAAERTRGARGEVLGRDGEAVVADRPVVEVGVQPSRAEDVDALAATLADLLDVDGAALGERIRSADPEAFVPVITLRQEDYDAVAGQVRPLAGTVLRESTLPLAPTREFARALLGTVGPATAELVEESQGRLAAGDVTGLSGLQRRYDERLAGTAGVAVSLIPAEGDPAELFAVPATDGEDVATTLDAAVQQAADAALAGAAGDNAALVAVDVPTGDVVAVANTPATGIDRAGTGRYPPGSTFKTVSTLALLPTGLTPEEVVPCPETASVGGRSFRNFEGGALGEVPFREAFAQSCNTAFVTLSQRLEPGDLAAAASGVGIGGDWSVGVDAFPGDVPVEESAVEVAEASIGQGRVLASPLAMAVAAATIARGAWEPPNLVTEPAPGGPDAAAAEDGEQPAPDADRLATVRDLMREVAVSGTASALADVPPAADGSAVHAKTGTAEFGSGDPLPTHAWTIGFRGDLAFAVLVEGGESGGSVAVPVVEEFLRSLG